MLPRGVRAAALGGRRAAQPGWPLAGLSTYAYHSPRQYPITRHDLDGKWDSLGFSIRNMNGHVKYTWSKGSWDDGIFVPAPYQLMHINSGALHYGVSVFEGMKAFETKDGKIQLLKPQLNAARMQRGADALLMPRISESMFVAGVKEAVVRNREFVPPYGHGASLYIRPLLFASGPMLGLAPLAEEYTFLVCVMPAGGYFQKPKPAAKKIPAGEPEAADDDVAQVTLEPGVKAFVSEDHDRAAPRGTGAVKAAGNYAADLNPVHSAQAKGYNTTLYLDAQEQRYIEEFSVANFIGITKEGVYVTPSSSTILASTTNELLMQIAQSKGITVERRPIDFNTEIQDFAEIGMCGTAAVVVRVESITRGGRTFTFDQFETIADLRETLTGIQCGEVEDTFGFSETICDVNDPMNPKFAPEMVTAEQRGLVRQLGDEGLHGHERDLLGYVVEHAERGNPESVLQTMDSFWMNILGQADPIMTEKWAARGQNIEQTVRKAVVQNGTAYEEDWDPVARACGKIPFRCLEIGTYCGYSALRIARNLPENGTLLSVEKDPLFAAIATKIIEYAGLDDKVKIWMGAIEKELASVELRFDNRRADFVLCDYALERYILDLSQLEARGIVDPNWTFVIADVDFYPGDDKPLPNDEAVGKLQETVVDWMDENEDYVHIRQVTPASLLGTAL